MNKNDIEREVLAGIFLNFENADRFLARFKETDFTNVYNQRCYKLIEKWYSLGKKTFDMMDIQSTYPKAFAWCGGVEYIGEVIADAINPQHYDSNAEALFKECIKEQIKNDYDIINNVISEDYFSGLDEYVNRANALYDRARVKSTHNLYQTFMDGINPEKNDGVSLGFDSLHEVAGKFYPGQLIIIGARPGVGKTAFALQLLFHYICMNKKKALMFSLEMSIKDLLVRMIAAISNIPTLHLQDANLNDEERKIAESNARELTANPYLKLFEDHVTDINSIRAAIRKENKDGNVGLVVVDYLQLITCASGKSIYEKVSEISRQLKTIALEYNCIVVALSQLSRATEDKSDKRPSMSELRGSGSIEQDANKILLLYRDDYYSKDRDSSIVPIEIDIAKNREGATGTVKLIFDLTTGRFSEMEEE